MPEEIITAQTTDNTEIDSHADVSQETENVNDVEFEDSAEESAPKIQSKEQNSENARRRREAERKAEIKKAEEAAREKAIIETLGGINPYTGEEIKDKADIDEYLTMREIEKNGGDPFSDYSKHQKQKAREKAQLSLKEEEEKKWYKADRDDFVSKHPDVNVDNLINDRQFQKFASGKVGIVSLSQIYEDFTDFVYEYDKKAKQMAKQAVANHNSSPGSLRSANYNGDGYFTREQVQKMSQKEVHQNYDRIRASMARWK